MSFRIKGGVGPVLRIAQRSDTNASVSHNYAAVQLSGGTTSLETREDANYSVYTAATYYREGGIVVYGMGDYEVENLTPTVGTVDSEGAITRLTSGYLKLIVRNRFLSLPITLDLRNKSDEEGQPTVFQSTVEGSLSEHCQQQIDGRINLSMTKATNGKIFTSQDHTTPAYVRNPNVWCADVDLTCISPWNSNGAHRKAGTLVTPQHIVNAAHYQISVGNTVRFVSADNTVYDRVVTGMRRHPDYKPYSPDLTLYTLDSALPAAISPCKLMPADYGDYLVNNYDTRPPALGLDQEEKALIIDFFGRGSFLSSNDEARLIFHENKIGGDSGNPAFLIVNDELVLVTVWTYGGAGSGTPVAEHIDALNSMIVDADAQAGVSTGYTVTTADFSSFPNYSA